MSYFLGNSMTTEMDLATNAISSPSITSGRGRMASKTSHSIDYSEISRSCSLRDDPRDSGFARSRTTERDDAMFAAMAARAISQIVELESYTAPTGL